MTMPGAEPAAEADGTVVDAREYLRILARRRWTIANTVVLCTVLAVGYVLLTPKSYPASATVLVKPIVADWSAASSPTTKTIDLATEQSVAASDVAANDVRTKLHLTTLSAADLLANLTVAPGTLNANTLAFSYADQNATTARNVALAFANDYLARRQGAAQVSLTRAQHTVATQIDQLQAQLSAEEARQSANNPPTPSETIAANQIGSLRSTQTRLSLATVDPGALISAPPAASSLSTSPKSSLLVAAGLLLGLVLGVILAFLRDRMSNQLFLSPTSTAGLRPAVLASVPLRPRALRRAARAAPLVLSDAGSPAAGGFERASEHVRAQLSSPHAVVLVTSATDEEASSVVAANLAAALAGTGTAVTLLTRLDPAALTRSDRAGAAATFADALTGRVSVSGLGVPAEGAPTLRVVSVGALAPDALRTNAALELVRLLQSSAQILVVDAPALLTGADGLALAATADMVLLTVVDRVTRRSSLVAAAEHAAAVGPPLLRTIVVTASRGQAAAGFRPVARRAPALPRMRTSAVGKGLIRTEAGSPTGRVGH